MLTPFRGPSAPARAIRRAAVLPTAAALLLGACASLDTGSASLAFSGYRWEAVESRLPIGPGPNIFSAANVSLDAAGRLVLSLRRGEGGWSCAEVFLDRSLSYGRYEIELIPPPDLDPRLVFGFYTWDEEDVFAHREIDIELSRWGESSYPDLNFTVQPAVAGRSRSAELPRGSPLLLRFDWRPEKITFLAKAGGGEVLWRFPDDREGSSPVSASSPGFLVPPQGKERVSLNLWLFRGEAPDLPPEGLSIVISRFAYLPLR